MNKTTRSFSWYALFFIFLMSADRISKYFARTLTQTHKVNEFLSFVLQYNRGISWGMFDSDNKLQFYGITSIVILFIIVFSLYTMVRLFNNYYIIGETMVLAGAISNIIDRFMYGGVVDFILLSSPYGSWPVFNGADALIVAGLSIILINGFYEKAG